MQSTLQATEFANKQDLTVDRARGRNVLHLGAIGAMCGADAARATPPHESLHAHLTRAAAKCIGVDNNQSAITELSEKGIFNNIMYADVAKITRADIDLPTIDIIVAGDIIEHLPDPGRVLEVISSLSDPGTEFVLTTPNALGAAMFLRNLAGRELEGPHHVCSFNAFTLRNLLARYGWAVDELKTCYQPEASDLNPASFRLGLAIFNKFPKLGGTLFVSATQRAAYSG